MNKEAKELAKLLSGERFSNVESEVDDLVRELAKLGESVNEVKERGKLLN